MLSPVIISGTSFDMMQLLVCSAAQRCWKALGQGIKWALVFNQLPEVTFCHLSLLFGCSHNQIFT